MSLARFLDRTHIPSDLDTFSQQVSYSERTRFLGSGVAFYAFSGQILTVPGTVSWIEVAFSAFSVHILTVAATVSSTGVVLSCIIRSHTGRPRSRFLDRGCVLCILSSRSARAKSRYVLCMIRSQADCPRSRFLDRDCILSFPGHILTVPGAVSSIGGAF